MPKPRAAQKSASRLRRESLASRGKRADTSKDRQRDSEMALKRRSAAEAKATTAGNCGCGGPCCQEAEAKAAPAPSYSAPASNGVTAKRKPVVNASSTGRMLSRARRAAMAGRGKAGLEAHGKNSSASLARQANPEISARDLARVVRESRSKNGSRGCTSAAPARARRPRNAAEAKLISGTNVAHTEKMTGDEAGLCHSGITGTDYMSAEVFDKFCQGEAPKAPTKVEMTSTLSGGRVTSGGKVGGSTVMTGAEKGSCRDVTGTEYLGQEDFAACKAAPTPSPAKVSYSQTSRGQIVSGSKPARSEKVTGDEAGTCKAVTGTPYAGAEQYRDYCEPSQAKLAQARGLRRSGNAGRDITGIQPGLEGLTGAEKGACKPVSGTGYIGASEQQEVCGAMPAQVGEPDFPQPMAGAPWGEFSVVPPSHASQQSPMAGNVTGTRYEQGRISGTFAMGEGKVTGTEQFRFGDSKTTGTVTPIAPAEVNAEEILKSRVTGEGIDTGLKITGDDWDRGDRVTGTEGSSAMKRNPTRKGPTSAMPAFAPKRNVELERPSATVTGSAGSTEKGAAITVSGGARG